MEKGKKTQYNSKVVDKKTSSSMTSKQKKGASYVTGSVGQTTPDNKTAWDKHYAGKYSAKNNKSSK